MHDIHWYGFESKLNLLDLVYEATHNKRTEYVWLLHKGVDYTGFDLRFVPDRYQQQMLHAWPAHNNKRALTTWLIPVSALLSKGYTGLEKVFHDEIILPSAPVPTQGPGWHWQLHPQIDYSDFDLEWFPDIWDWEMDHGFAMQGTDQLAFTFMRNGHVADAPVKYHKSDLRFDERIIVTKSLDDALRDFAGQDRFIWLIDDRIDYSGFDFDWLPDDWDKDKLHCFTMENKKQLAYTSIVNPKHYDRSKSPVYHPSDLRMSNHLEFVTLEMIGGTDDIMGRKQRYFGHMEDALRTAIRKSKQEWLWVLSDCCDYYGFDFSWLPDLDQKDQVHCWPSGTCEKGETFLINAAIYSDGRDFKFNFEHIPVPRKPWPVINYYGDSLAEVIAAKPSKSLYTLYVHGSESFDKMPEPCLWKDRPVIGMNRSNSVSLVPRDCVAKREIYEYPHLERKTDMATDSKMDVIFISNGEPQAVENYARLLDLCDAKAVSGINGRLNSYQTAAKISSTDWFIAVFAKCWVLEDFANLEWYPDYWQEPKHYIFLNHNENNGLTYGHMAPIAYNTRLMLDNKGGLDMTLAQAHAVVPIPVSSTWLEGDPWISWRTAFREVIKLLYYSDENPTMESQHRLWTWENRAIGMDAEWLLRGARDARAYYERCGGELSWLLMSNEWDWCRKYFDDLYNADLTT